MAKRMKSKIQPAVMTFCFRFDHLTKNVPQKQYIDLSQCASILNRRFYRQGLNWAVAQIKIFTTDEGQIIVNKLPNTWVMSNSWEKGFRSYQKMIKTAIADGESNLPKFQDFKIYANQDHYTEGFSNNLLPVDGEMNQAKPGEWISSKIHIPIATTAIGTQSYQSLDCSIKAVGANSFTGQLQGNVVSLIDGYANSRAYPETTDPNTPPDMNDVTGLSPENWIQALHNGGTEQNENVLDDLEVENNGTPYPIIGMSDPAGGAFTDTMYPGGGTQLSALERHSAELITSTTVGGATTIRGGNFPCGLMEIGSSLAKDNSQVYMEISLVPGTHRGYLAEPMTEM